MMTIIKDSIESLLLCTDMQGINLHLYDLFQNLYSYLKYRQINISFLLLYC